MSVSVSVSWGMRAKGGPLGHPGGRAALGTHLCASLSAGWAQAPGAAQQADTCLPPGKHTSPVEAALTREAPLGHGFPSIRLPATYLLQVLWEPVPPGEGALGPLVDAPQQGEAAQEQQAGRTHRGPQHGGHHDPGGAHFCREDALSPSCPYPPPPRTVLPTRVQGALAHWRFRRAPSPIFLPAGFLAWLPAHSHRK